MKTAHILILWLLTVALLVGPASYATTNPPFEIKRANGACTVATNGTITCTAAAARTMQAISR